MSRRKVPPQAGSPHANRPRRDSGLGLKPIAGATALACACLSAPAWAQPSSAPVTREEYQKLQQQINSVESNYQREISDLKAKLKALKNQPPPPAGAPQPAGASDVEQRVSELESQLDDVRSLALSSKPGNNKFVVTGFGSVGYTNAEGSNSSFTAGFNPIILYKLGERVFAEAELEFTYEDNGDTATELEFAKLAYIVNDHLTLSGGRFLTPLSTFKEHLHPTWINKLPDQPLFAEGPIRLIPTSSLGFEGRGAFAMGKTKLTYAAYVTNGFALDASGPTAGQLTFDNNVDLNNGKSGGARIGFFPFPALEVVYAFNLGKVGAPGAGNPTALVQDIAISYVKESEKIGGKLDVRGELVFSRVNDQDFGSGVFNNNRNGGYAQIAYRPTMSDSFFQNVEGVFRYDFVNQPSNGGAPASFDENRYTVGVNYWLSPSAVLKFAYQIDAKSGATMDNNAFMVQFAIGF